MRKITLIGLVLLMVLALGSTAVGESAAETLSFSGTLEAAEAEAILAPFEGVVLHSGVKTGDSCAASTAMFELSTRKVYAPCDGTVTGLFAREGDSISDITAVYDAPMYIEPTSAYVISATTSSAYNTTENKYIHVGEQVYVFCTSAKTRTGAGIVTAVDGSSYTVEVMTHENLRLNENCYISRSSNPDDDKARIGSGKTKRSAPIAVAAEGSVLRLAVQAGGAVQKGDLLMEVVNGDLAGLQTKDGTIRAANDLVIMSVNVSVGESVSENHLLATAFFKGSLEAVVQVDESDLGHISIGDNVTIELDGASGKLYEGTIVSIASVANEKASGVEYDVTVSFENDDFVRQGMSVTVTR